MQQDINYYIDWFLKQHNNDHRSAIAWLIGRMNSAEIDVAEYKKQSCERLHIPSVPAWTQTTLQSIDKEEK